MTRTPYIPVGTIRKYAEEVLFEYERMVGRLPKLILVGLSFQA